MAVKGFFFPNVLKEEMEKVVYKTNKVDGTVQVRYSICVLL